MRLDIHAEAVRLAHKVNGSEKPRLIYVRGTTPYCTSVGSYEYGEAFKGAARRVVGVYEPGVTAAQIADDLAEVM